MARINERLAVDELRYKARTLGLHDVETMSHEQLVDVVERVEQTRAGT